MKKTAIIIAVIFISNTVIAQKYFTKSGHISFYSTTLVEDIEAHNYQSTSIMNFETGEMVFSLLMKGFEFEKALMQEHFNEKYVESDDFPKAKFKGEIKDFQSIDLSKEGEVEISIDGEMTIHGVTQLVSAQATIEVKDGKILGNSEFVLLIEDYDINIPSVVKDKIAKKMTIKVEMDYKLYVKK